MKEFGYGLIYLLCGIFMIGWPLRLLRMMDTCLAFIFFVNGTRKLLKAGKNHKVMDIGFGLLSIGFAVFIFNDQHFSNEIIRMGTAVYMLMYCVSCLVQYLIDLDTKEGHALIDLGNGVFSLFIGFYLIIHPHFDVNVLIILYGIYCMGLAGRSFLDGWTGIKKDYHWQRKHYLMLPAIVLAFLPGQRVQRLQKQTETEMMDQKTNEKTFLKVMVQVGPQGLQKVGHIAFAYKDCVYSYGNYDAESSKLNGTMGDGVFFMLPFDAYLDQMLHMEKNSVFEYGISISKKQARWIEQEIKKLKERSKRWFCAIERENGFSHAQDYMNDYPSRLRNATQVQFYKIWKGKFKTYWALGDNCAQFTNIVFSKLGSAILNSRGVVSPGAYFVWLEHEFKKAKSPIVYRKIHIAA